MYDLLLGKEEKACVAEVCDFVASVPVDLLRRMDREEVHYPREFLEEAARRKLIGLRFDPRWGGRGVRWLVEMAAIEEVGLLGTSLACLYSLPSIIGEAIARFGTDEQKAAYLAPVLRGEKTCAEALTEPRGGSDFFGTTTRAERKGDSFVLNGQKRFVVGSEGADFFLVYARTDPDVASHQGISVFLVDRGPGVRVEAVYRLMGTRGGGTGRLLFEDVVVPARNLVGGLNKGADVFNWMMVPERLTSAAGAVGMARAALAVAARYSGSRMAFGQKIRKFQAVSFKVADSATAIDSARSLVCNAAMLADSGADSRRLVSEAKKHATTTAWDVVNHAMQIMGGIGYTDIYPIERLMRDARLALIWTGTNEIMSLLIQHEYYKELEASRGKARDIEQDATGAELIAEKHYG